MSPEKWLPVVPVRARPSGTRRARALHWPGSSGASVATIAMTEPAPGGGLRPRSTSNQSLASGLSSSNSGPTCLPATVNSTRDAEVRLHERSDREGPSPVADPPRRGTVAALEFVAVHPGSAADRSFGDRTRGRRVERRLDVLGSDVAAVDVVEVAVPGLGADGQQPLPGEPRIDRG